MTASAEGQLCVCVCVGVLAGLGLGAAGCVRPEVFAKALVFTPEDNVQIPMAVTGSWKGELWWGRPMSWAWCCRPFSSQLLHSFWNWG